MGSKFEGTEFDNVSQSINANKIKAYYNKTIPTKQLRGKNDSIRTSS